MVISLVLSKRRGAKASDGVDGQGGSKAAPIDTIRSISTTSMVCLAYVRLCLFVLGFSAGCFLSVEANLGACLVNIEP